MKNGLLYFIIIIALTYLVAKMDIVPGFSLETDTVEIIEEEEVYEDPSPEVDIQLDISTESNVDLLSIGFEFDGELVLSTSFPMVCDVICDNYNFKIKIDVNPKDDELYVPFGPHIENCEINCEEVEE